VGVLFDEQVVHHPRPKPVSFLKAPRARASMAGRSRSPAAPNLPCSLRAVGRRADGGGHDGVRREEWQVGANEDWRFTDMAANMPRQWWWVKFWATYVSQQPMLVGLTLPLYALHSTPKPWDANEEQVIIAVSLTGARAARAPPCCRVLLLWPGHSCVLLLASHDAKLRWAPCHSAASCLHIKQRLQSPHQPGNCISCTARQSGSSCSTVACVLPAQGLRRRTHRCSWCTCTVVSGCGYFRALISSISINQTSCR
jgi:hypothetical protein